MYKIFNEDCFETMKKLRDDSIDLVLTSPPYNGVVNKSMYIAVGKEKRYDEYVDNKSTPAYIEWTINLFKEFDRIVKPNRPILYNFSYNNYEPMLVYWLINEIYANTNWMVVDTIVWKKARNMANFMSPNKLSRKWEYVFVFCRKNEKNTFQIREREYSVKSNNTHRYKKTFSNFIEATNNDAPTELNKATYSSELVHKLLDVYANENYVIYDPFMGTGTTAYACKTYNMELKCIGSELSAEQCNYANNRLTT